MANGRLDFAIAGVEIWPMSSTLPPTDSGLSHPAPSFARGLWRIAAADVSSGNRVRLLRDGPATFDAMIALLERARTDIALESYIFRSDDVGRRFADALLQATARGVRVRLLLD